MKRKDRKTAEKVDKNVLRLADNHTWKAPKGYKIIMADRGAVSFNIPESWHLAKMESLELLDREPPNDNARVTLSFWRLPAGIDWSGLPLAEMLSEAIKEHPHKIISRGELVKSTRGDIEIVWMDHRFQDPQENREAYSRFALVRGWNVQALITFDFWVEDLEKSKLVWDEILRSLQLGRSIQDPTKGIVLH